MAWSRLAGVLGDDGDGRVFWRRALEPSLRHQARFLAANLEHDVPNNHLLANFRALAWVGLLLDHWPEGRRWRRRWMQGLQREMRRQVLPDGVHAERSVSYHAIVLQDLLLAGAALFDRPVWADAGADRSYVAWLGLEERLSPPVSEAAPRKLFPEAGYAVLRDPEGDGVLFFDAGPIGPAGIPGHGHAEALSIVLSGGGRRLIVDPGIDTYEDGRARDELRSIRIHNTVTLDELEPCLFWGAFRVAHLPPAALFEGSQAHVEGEHRGYWKRSGVAHRRRIERRRDTWEIRDCFTGHGEHRFVLNLQLALDCEALIVAGEDGGRDGEAVWPDGVRLRIQCLGAPGSHR